MSHFIGLCFGDWWESNIEPFAEDLQVEEWEWMIDYFGNDAKFKVICKLTICLLCV